MVHGCKRESSGSQRPALDIADIIRVHGQALRKLYPLTAEQAAALRDIERCRTAALGGHLDECKTCGWSRPSYNSCRNRHCPKCQALRQAVWIESRVARTLATHHFHVVFTLPAELRPLAQLHPAFVYKQLFDCASATLLELGRDPKRLGAQLGMTIVLHTWARNLSLHPHVHCIVTGGGLTADGREWKRARRDFLFPVAVMRKLFRGKLLDAIVKANAEGKLNRSDGSPWLGPTTPGSGISLGCGNPLIAAVLLRSHSKSPFPDKPPLHQPGSRTTVPSARSSFAVSLDARRSARGGDEERRASRRRGGTAADALTAVGSPWAG